MKSLQISAENISVTFIIQLGIFLKWEVVNLVLQKSSVLRNLVQTLKKTLLAKLSMKYLHL